MRKTTEPPGPVKMPCADDFKELSEAKADLARAQAEYNAASAEVEASLQSAPALTTAALDRAATSMAGGADRQTVLAELSPPGGHYADGRRRRRVAERWREQALVRVREVIGRVSLLACARFDDEERFDTSESVDGLLQFVRAQLRMAARRAALQEGGFSSGTLSGVIGGGAANEPDPAHWGAVSQYLVESKVAGYDVEGIV